MRFDLLTLFPKMCAAATGESILARAVQSGIIEIGIHDIREYTQDKHRRVDDYPYGGGFGMVMQVQPVADCLKAVTEKQGKKPYVIYMSPKGSKFDQEKAKQLMEHESIAIICGHYEGVDQRIIDLYCDEEISIGDFVLTGGELPALCIVDAVSRMVKGVLSDDACFEDESIYGGLLEYPHYTRPPEYEGAQVPEVLLSGHHENIDRWRREQALRLTYEKRPDLLQSAELSKADRKYLEMLKNH